MNPPAANGRSDRALSHRDVLQSLVLGGAAATLGACSSALHETAGLEMPSDATVPADAANADITRPGDTAVADVAAACINRVMIPRSASARGGPDMSRITPMNGVELITFHQSSEPRPFLDDTFAGTARRLEDVREFHRSRHFEDIGEHYAIDRMGRVWQLRDARYQGEHVREHNAHNLGIYVLGNFNLQVPTEKQKATIQTFGRLLRDQYTLPISRIFTHQELVNSECPGRALQPFMVAVRRERLI